MTRPSRPFEKYRTRSALFLMIYGVTALIGGVFNISMVTDENDKRILLLFFTSILVVSRYVGYVKLAGFALLSSEHIRIYSGRIAFTLWAIVLILLANAAFFLYRFGLTDLTVTAISVSCIGTAGVLISHLVGSIPRGITRSRLMRMVSGVLIVLGCGDICILDYSFLSPAIGLITLFFGIYTERKSMALALRQTVAAAGGAAGGGIAAYYLRYFVDPSLTSGAFLNPTAAVLAGIAISVAGIGYYFISRRMYDTDSAFTKL